MKIYVINYKKILIRSIIPIILVIILSTLWLSQDTITTFIEKDTLKPELQEMFKMRDQAALKNDSNSVKYMFDTSKKIGTWAFEHEKTRIKYLNDWCIMRNAKFLSMESDVKISRIRDRGKTIWVDFLHAGKFTYTYNDLPDQANTFGIGTRRTVELERVNNKWIIKREWYLDPFEDIIQIPEDMVAMLPHEDINIVSNDVFYSSTVYNDKKRYDREKAVEYADKYCGATFGSSNDYKYNKKYRDYSYLGGDCANFTSQVLTEGGGLKMSGSWFYNYKYKGIGGGTLAWVRASNLKDYLVYSGKVKLIKRGKYEDLINPSDKYPEGAHRQLQKGDLISYEKKGEIDHFSIVTGFDSKGFPLVNSHSTDRYRVPWDLGWTGSDIKFWLLHVRD